MSKTRFDDYSDIPTLVDCNKCEAYWNNQCDGAVKGSEKPCKAFVAIRRVDIPLEIKRLRKAVNSLSLSLLVVGFIAVIALALAIGGY